MLISASEVKANGVSFIGKLIKKHKEVFITVRGKKKFAVLPIEEYERLKEAELDRLILEAEKDYEEGRYIKETAEEHFKRLGI